MNIPLKLWLPYVLLGIAPGLIWMIFYLKEDSKNPEPKGKIAQAFILGMAATLPAAVLEIILGCSLGYKCSFYSDHPLYSNKLLANPLVSKIVFMFIVIAAVEEVFKYLVVRSEVLKSNEFDEPVDAMIYSITAALGFASAENVLYIFAYSGSPISTTVERFFTAILIHALAGGIIGYYIGSIKLWEMKKNQFLPGIRSSRKSFILILKGVLLAIILHGIYNFLVNIDDRIAMLIIFILIISTALLISAAFEKLKNNRAIAFDNSLMYNKNK